MERLTKWNGKKWVLPQGRKSNGRSYWREITEKLMLYENIGEPSEIEERLAKPQKIRAIVKHPGLEPMLCEIENSLEELQMIVGGHIECVTRPIGIVIVCNEEGRLYDAPFNTQLDGIEFYGTIVIIGEDEEDFTDVPEYLVKMYGM